MDYYFLPTSVQQEQRPRFHLRFQRFVPFKPAIVYRINRDVSGSALDAYRRQAKRTSLFIMYLLRTDYNGSEQMKEIAIELYNSLASITTVLLFETSSLPGEAQPKFLRIKRLLRTIFHSSKRIITWNDEYLNLYPLFNLRYLQRRQQSIAKFIPLHDRFKIWFRDLYPHEPHCHNALHNIRSHYNCSCGYRQFSSRLTQWDLFDAHERAFLETPFVSEHLASEIYPMQTIIIGNHAIAASVFGCLALSKLRTAIASYWSQTDLTLYNTRRHPRPPRSMHTFFY